MQHTVKNSNIVIYIYIYIYMCVCVCYRCDTKLNFQQPLAVSFQFNMILYGDLLVIIISAQLLFMFIIINVTDNNKLLHLHFFILS